jgi:8-oxo-dGTP pyrophosphatase MutT (NUDIX family)
MSDLPENIEIEEILEKVIPQEDFLSTSKIIYSTPAVNVKTFDVEKDSKPWIGVFSKVENVVVLPYITNEHGMIKEIGLLKEFNPIREGNYSDTLVTGSKEDTDDTMLETAQRELLEETGYKCIDDDKWTYLGLLTGSKMIDIEHPCYAVSLNDIKPGKIDKDSIESMSKFRFVPLNEAIKSTDAYVLSLIMKIFIANNSRSFIIEEK